jgi:putative toxin-antitoxin system antitoxin component (TIGR02293 family)
MARPSKRSAARRVAAPLTFRRLVAHAPDPDQAIASIRLGLQANAIDEAVDYLAVPRKDLLAALRIPASTFHRRVAANEPLSPAESEKVLRLGELLRHAEATFGAASAARDWLTTSNLALGDTPLSLVDTEAGAAQVRRVLSTLDYGGVA